MTIEVLVVIGLGIIVLLVLVIFLMPSESKKKKKKQRPQAEPQNESHKEWEAKVGRLEKHIRTLNDEILAFQKKEKENEKDLTIERVKNKKIREKLSQERQWHTKEQDAIDKKTNEFKQLKAELVKMQDNFSKEHTANIHHEQKIKELESRVNVLNEQRRAAEAEAARLKAQSDGQRRDLARLKKENIELQKKEEDVNWIARGEYERVVEKLKEAEKKLEGFNRT